MSRASKNPSALDLYESAWAAIEKESDVQSVEELRAEGWRCLADFPHVSRQTMDSRIRKPGKFERQLFKVRPGGDRAIRQVMFFRPLCS